MLLSMRTMLTKTVQQRLCDYLSLTSTLRWQQLSDGCVHAGVCLCGRTGAVGEVALGACRAAVDMI